MKSTKQAGQKFKKLVEILSVLRSKNGCPWDKEQDEKSIANFFLEEVYEAVDAISADNAGSLEEELGDVLMEVVFLAQIYKENGKFTISDVLEGIVQKMVRRHPHVFGSKRVRSSQKVTEVWQEQKNAEKERISVFDGMAKSTPSLLEAFQIGQRVSAFGFDWRCPREVLYKIKEEINELQAALEEGKGKKIQEEMGDVFFALASLSCLLGLNPELALRKANNKFKRRFLALEKEQKKAGKELGQASLEDMDRIWDKLKKRSES